MGNIDNRHLFEILVNSSYLIVLSRYTEEIEQIAPEETKTTAHHVHGAILKIILKTAAI